MCAGQIDAHPAEDPYRWLENSDAARVQSWGLSQNHKAKAYFAADSELKRIEGLLRPLFEMDTLGLPEPVGKRLFYKQRFAGKDKPSYFWRDGGPSGTAKLWLDPATLSNDTSTSVGDWTPSPNGRYAAYMTHAEGADEAILYVRDTESGRDLTPDIIPGANFADVSWSADSEGFYYMRLPVGDRLQPSERVARADIRYHRLGDQPQSDRLIFPPTMDASAYLSAAASEDGKWLFVTTSRGWTSNEIRAAPLGGTTLQFQTIFASTSAIAHAREWKSRFYLWTNDGAGHGKILSRRTKGRAWETIIPERPGVVIDSMRIVGDCVILGVFEKATSGVEAYDLKGRLIWQIPIPPEGLVKELSGQPGGNRLFISYESFFMPPRIYVADVGRKTLALWAETKVPIDAGRFQTDLVWYESKDRTKISMMVVHQKKWARNGASALLLEGYGGFNTPMLPRFSPEILAWLEEGGIYAVPHLRGGGEYGEAWHRAGMLTKKQNTFDDFIAAAQYLIREGYTHPEHLAIQGVSNGGLLVSAVLTQRPDLFRAVICKNPLTDMVRYPLFGEGKAWLPEYGSPDNSLERSALLAYSPYHHVVTGVHYPSLLMFAGEHDDRVDPMHARKFVAALQAADRSGHPILFRLLAHSGHAVSDKSKDQLREMAERLVFLSKELGLRP